MKGFAHLLITLVLAVFVIPVIVTIVLAVVGAGDLRIYLALPIGILWFIGYWIRRGVKAADESPYDLPPVELPPDQRRPG